MKTIVWNESFSCCDNQAETEASKLLDRDTIYTGNALVIDFARYLVVTGELESFVLEVNGKEVTVNEYGVLSGWPRELDVQVSIAEKLLKEQLKKRKAKKRRNIVV
jgi:ligand-binding sensor protein